METIWKATLCIKVEGIEESKDRLDGQLDMAEEIIQQIEELLESLYRAGGQYHRDGFVVEFEEC